jgi:hypothetical protein
MPRYQPTWRRKLLPAVLVLLLAGGCKDDDPAPTTGGLVISFSGASRYALYTETLLRTGPALYEGTSSTGPNKLTFDELHPGTYIFQRGPAGNNFNEAVQVVAGKQREYTF